MELSDLKYFMAVANTGGIVTAAERLNRVPSNVTTRIQKLETELNQHLFIREKKRLFLSPAGARFKPYAEKLLSLSEETLHAMKESEPQGLLRIGSIEAMAASRLSPILAKFHLSYPNVELQVSTHPTGDLLDKVLLGELDMAIVSDPGNDVRLQIEPVFKEHLVLVSSCTLQNIKCVQDLGDNAVLLGFSTQCRYRNKLQDWIESSGAHANVIEINSYHAMLNCVAAGMGVGLIPEVLLDSYSNKRDLNVHQLPEDIALSYTSVVWRKDLLSENIKAFRVQLSQFENLQ
ncbi:MAG: LysR family transcriptional regulator [Pseudomonadota bacterium]